MPSRHISATYQWSSQWKVSNMLGISSNLLINISQIIKRRYLLNYLIIFLLPSGLRCYICWFSEIRIQHCYSFEHLVKILINFLLSYLILGSINSLQYIWWLGESHSSVTVSNDFIVTIASTVASSKHTRSNGWIIIDKFLILRNSPCGVVIFRASLPWFRSARESS